jgi:hypothetical protein
MTMRGLEDAIEGLSANVRSPLDPVKMDGVQLLGTGYGVDQVLSLVYEARLNWILKTIFVYMSSPR